MSCGTAFLISWMAFSAFFVVSMKLTLTVFAYPLCLTGLHMLCCWICFGFIRWSPCPDVRRRLMPDSEKEISWSDYVWAIVPIALLNAGGLALGNVAVNFASVAFLQMIKPANLIWGSLVAFAVRVEVASVTHMIIVAIVVSGVSIASSKNAEFNLSGFIFQLAATITEGAKLVMIQAVTSKRLKLDPLTAIYKYAPIASGCLFALSCGFEGIAPWMSILQQPIAVGLNASAAVLLNVLIVGTVSRTSAVIFILGGVVKDIGTIVASMVIFGSPVGANQIVGFGFSLVGILMYKAYKQNLDTFLEVGFIEGFRRVFQGTPDSASDNHKDEGAAQSAEELQAMIGVAADALDDLEQAPQLANGA